MCSSLSKNMKRKIQKSEPLMMPRIKSKKKKERKEIKLHNLVNKPASESMMGIYVYW